MVQWRGDERETWYIYHYPAPYMHNLLEKDRPQWQTQIIHGNRRPPSTKQEYHSSILWYMDTLIWKCEIGVPLKNLPKTFLPPPYSAYLCSLFFCFFCFLWYWRTGVSVSLFSNFFSSSIFYFFFYFNFKMPSLLVNLLFVHCLSIAFHLIKSRFLSLSLSLNYNNWTRELMGSDCIHAFSLSKSPQGLMLLFISISWPLQKYLQNLKPESSIHAFLAIAIDSTVCTVNATKDTTTWGSWLSFVVLEESNLLF